jgi:hypothetical protein
MKVDLTQKLLIQKTFLRSLLNPVVVEKKDTPLVVRFYRMQKENYGTNTIVRLNNVPAEFMYTFRDWHVYPTRWAANEKHRTYEMIFWSGVHRSQGYDQSRDQIDKSLYANSYDGLKNYLEDQGDDLAEIPEASFKVVDEFKSVYMNDEEYPEDYWIILEVVIPTE